MCRDSRALSSRPRDRSLEGTYLLGMRMADQGDEGLGLCGHGTLVDEYLLDVEVLQGVGRRGGARTQDDIVALQFVCTSFCQDVFVPDGQCRRYQVTYRRNISRFPSRNQAESILS